MEHAEARELLEIAALEPDGFDRLAAGDTAEAAALAGHVAGCSECAAELERLRRASAVIREAVRTAPSADLRDRTLAYVAAVGRPRGGEVPAVQPEPIAVGGGGAVARRQTGVCGPPRSRPRSSSRSSERRSSSPSRATR